MTRQRRLKLALSLGLAAMLASPALAQRDRPGQGREGRPRMGPPSGLLQLVMAEPVQQELGLGRQQAERVRTFTHRVRQDAISKLQSRREQLRGLDPAERRQQFEQIQAEIDEQARAGLKDILRAEQMQRLEEILLQQAGYMALTEPRVQEQLGLSGEQKSQIERIAEQFRNETRSLMQESRGQNADPQQTMDEFEKARREAMTRVSNVLTDEQRLKWDEMLGEPFQMPPPRAGGGGAEAPSRGGQQAPDDQLPPSSP